MRAKREKMSGSERVQEEEDERAHEWKMRTQLDDLIREIQGAIYTSYLTFSVNIQSNRNKDEQRGITS